MPERVTLDMAHKVHMMLEAASSFTRPKNLGPLGACRACGADLQDVFVDLGMQPLCESYVDEAGLSEAEAFYPLRAFVCRKCLLVQTQDFATPEQIFREYAYFSSYSTSWLEHAALYCRETATREALGPDSFVVELASNDGYLLRNFVQMGFRVLGIDPAANVAAAARQQGVPTLVEFFGARVAEQVATENGRANLIVANNVLAHVPDINDFVAGVAKLLAPQGVASFEFPHLLELIRWRQFDTIYHEHFSYLSLVAVDRLLAAHGLQAVDVERLPTHGGSLRLWVAHAGTRPVDRRVHAIRDEERTAGLTDLGRYEGFGTEVASLKRVLLKLLIGWRDQGLKVAGYGAPGKANTLINYCGIDVDLLPFTVDRNPYKQGKYLPGSHIPIYAPEEIDARRPGVILILPWNLKDEIAAQLAYTANWGARLAVPIPEPTLI